MNYPGPKESLVTTHRFGNFGRAVSQIPIWRASLPSEIIMFAVDSANNVLSRWRFHRILQ